MAGDYTRFTFDAAKRYAAVLQQQGRVALDSDWNEESDILKRRLRLLAVDALGPEAIAWRATPDAFEIGLLPGAPPDLSIGEGRAYIDGWLAEHFTGEGATYLSQPFYPDPPLLPAAGDLLVFLRLFEREITYIEDPGLIDPALGGVDTTTRTQMAWQVLAVAPPQGAECGIDPHSIFPPSPARLSTEATLAPAPDDPCVLPPEDGYRGTVNSLYRVQVHTPGALGTATFKWSRDNASIVSAVTDIQVGGGQTVVTVDRIGRDQVLRFQPLQWVELTDDHRELMGEPGELAQIIDIDEESQELTLDRVLPSPGNRAFGANADELEARHTRLVAWNQNQDLNPTITGDGEIPIPAGAITLELGIEATFTLDGGTDFQVGDAWVFAARTADASVEELDAEPPMAVRSRYMQLAAIEGIGGDEPLVHDCRPRGPGCDCCCFITIGRSAGAPGNYDDLQSAVAALPGVAPDESQHVILCFAPGDFEIPGTVTVSRANLSIRGCGPATRLLPQQGPALVLDGTRQILEDLTIFAEAEFDLLRVGGSEQVVQRVELENQGSGQPLRGSNLDDFRFRDSLALGSGGISLEGNAIDIHACRILGGPLWFGDGSDQIRVRECDLLGSTGHAIVLGTRRIVYRTEILRNRISFAAGNAITNGFFDPEGNDDGIVAGLTVRGNKITHNLQGTLERGSNDPPFGAIVLGRVYDLVVEDNRIEDNGEEATAAVSPIYARHSRGVAISRNIVRGNGRRASGNLFDGPQACVSLRDASVGLRRLVDPEAEARRIAEVDVVPAVLISDNRIESRRGQAIWIRGRGRMAVEDNQLHASDILADLFDNTFDTLDQYVGTVFLVNLGLPAYFGAFLAGIGFEALAPSGPRDIQGSPLITSFIVGGQTIFRGNQARLDLARFESELALANIMVVSLDDTLVAGNQTEGVLFAGIRDDTVNDINASLDILLSDLFNLAITTRQTDNGLMSTPYLTAYSLLSWGFFNHCTDNQATSCILPVGISPKSVDRDNTVIFPHPTFCPDEPEG
jgi:hypothetical protein